MSDERLEFDGYAMATADALIAAATMLAATGERPSVAVVSWERFRYLLAEHKPGSANSAPAFPYPGVFLQAPTGWFYVGAEERIPKNRAIIRDAVTGASIDVKLA